MPFRGFEGPAGTGKTHHLIESIAARLAANPLADHQNILALTFMHGARRRLDDRMASRSETRNRAHCATIDSFASHLVRRWRPLVGALPDMRDFDAVCDTAGQLLERREIAKWVAESFPIIAVDEAQELKACRLRMVRALVGHCEVAVAADEFQCLDEAIDTAPFLEWFETGEVRRLDRVHRTNRPGLLSAGIALRAGARPVQGAGLKIRYDFPNQMPFSIGHALNAAGGSTAVLVAPGSARWASELIPRLAAGFRSDRQVVRPIRIGWETAPSTEAQNLAHAICPDGDAAAIAITIELSRLANPPAWVRQAISSIDYARRAHGRASWTRDELEALFVRKANNYRAYGYAGHIGVPVMSIHGAKNRQFRNVIVLWGPGVTATPDYQRRLLYNAITRAEQECTVFVKTRDLLAAPPFT